MTETCLAGRRCACYDHQNQHSALIRHPGICPDCIRVGERAAAQLVLDYRDLAGLLAASISQNLTGMPGGSSEGSVPIRVDVEALQRAIWWVTTAWAEVLADLDRLAGLSKRTRDGYAVQWACGILAPRVATLADLGDMEMADYPLTTEDAAIRHRSVALTIVSGAQAVLDLTWLHDRARGMLGLTEITRRLHGYCANPRCGRPNLQQRNGSDTVNCGTCGTGETREDYDRRINVLLISVKGSK